MSKPLTKSRKEKAVKEITTNVLLGDSSEILKTFDENSIDLIVTSPPYADRRKDTYGGFKPGKYVEWFLPISGQLLSVLKQTILIRILLIRKYSL